MKVRAAVLDTIGLERPYKDTQPQWIGELDLDPPGDGEVLVEIKASDSCHSALSLTNEGFDRFVDGATIHRMVVF